MKVDSNTSLSFATCCYPCRCGKTTICQLFAALDNQQLYSVNCHMHSESSDFLGGLRPVRSRGTEEQVSGYVCGLPLLLAVIIYFCSYGGLAETHKS